MPNVATACGDVLFQLPLNQHWNPSNPPTFVPWSSTSSTSSHVIPSCLSSVSPFLGTLPRRPIPAYLSHRHPGPHAPTWSLQSPLGAESANCAIGTSPVVPCAGCSGVRTKVARHTARRAMGDPVNQWQGPAHARHPSRMPKHQSTLSSSSESDTICSLLPQCQVHIGNFGLRKLDNKMRTS
jgi:hypothetical protein